MDQTLEQLTPHCLTLDQFLSIPHKFPLLTNLDIHAFDFKYVGSGIRVCQVHAARARRLFAVPAS